MNQKRRYGHLIMSTTASRISTCRLSFGEFVIPLLQSDENIPEQVFIQFESIWKEMSDLVGWSIDQSTKGYSRALEAWAVGRIIADQWYLLSDKLLAHIENELMARSLTRETLKELNELEHFINTHLNKNMLENELQWWKENMNEIEIIAPIFHG